MFILMAARHNDRVLQKMIFAFFVLAAMAHDTASWDFRDPSYSSNTEQCIKASPTLEYCRDVHPFPRFDPKVAVECCQAVKTFNNLGCFCNPAITSIDPRIQNLTSLLPILGPLCHFKPQTPNRKGSCPSRLVKPGVCNKPDIQLDAERLSNLNKMIGAENEPDQTVYRNLLTTLVDPNITYLFTTSGHFDGFQNFYEYYAILNRVIKGTGYGKSFFEGGRNDAVCWTTSPSQMPKERPCQGMDYSGGNDGACAVVHSSFPSYLNDGYLGVNNYTTIPSETLINATNIRIKVDVNVSFYEGKPWQTVLPHGNTTWQLRYDRCGSILKDLVLDVDENLLFYFTRGADSAVENCFKIMKDCNGSNQQYSGVAECMEFWRNLRPQTCKGYVLRGNSTQCRWTHLQIVKFDPAVHCPHVGKHGGPDPEHGYRCCDAGEQCGREACDEILPITEHAWPHHLDNNAYMPFAGQNFDEIRLQQTSVAH